MVNAINKPKKRNEVLDAVRGVAIIMVMIGHCITVNTVGAENTVFFNVIWSLQMPLFFLISGYVNRYSRPLKTAKDLLAYFKRRTVSYMLPWLVWTIIIKYFIVGKSVGLFSYLKDLVFSMDSGYWFLWVLWVICIIYGIASFIANKLSDKSFKQQFITCVVSVILSVVPLASGIVFGLNFLAVKLILYYLPFYYIGYIISMLDSYLNVSSEKCAKAKQIKTIIFVPILIVYLFVVYHHNLNTGADTIINIIIRFIASLFGSFVVCWGVSVLVKNDGKITQTLINFGTHSLELYLIHGLFLSLIESSSKPLFTSLNGIILCIVNFAVMITLSAVLITAISSNKYSKFVFFGKRS